MRAYMVSALLASGLVLGLTERGRPLSAQDARKGAGPLVVVDHDGKEFKVTSGKFLVGTRRLSWLAPSPAAKDGKGGKDAGPEALEVREEKSTTYQDGILTLVPLTALKKIEYDPEKKTVKVTYLRTGAKGAEEDVLTGSTAFKKINKLVLEGEIDLGELGKAARTFQGGNPKGVRSIAFPSPVPVPAPSGRPAVVTARDKEKTTHKLSGLEPLYVVEGGSTRTLPTLLFKTTVKVDLAKVQSLRFVPVTGRSELVLDFEVTLKDGKQHTLTLLQKTNPEDGKPALLRGLVGRTASGYKLFPPHTIQELRFDEVQPAPKKE